MNLKNTKDMNNRFLFPKQFKNIGFLIAIPAIILGYFCMHQNFQFNFLHINLPFMLSSEFSDKKVLFDDLNLTNTLVVVITIIGLLMIAFSKEKIEDEYVAQIRLESLQWAIYFNFALLIIITFLVYGIDYFSVTVYNMFTPLVIFILRFNYILHIKPSFEKSPERSFHEQ